MVQHLVELIESTGRQAVRLKLSGDAEAVVLPHGGRLLGLYAGDSCSNFLWNNRALQSRALALALFGSGAWPNPGGDRTWLAPELELFIGDPGRVFETYAVPVALDPGHWSVVSAGDEGVQLTQATTLRLKHRRRDVGLVMGKWFRPAANPLAGTALGGRVQYAGYSQVTSLELEPGEAPYVRLGIWNLLQLPQPGTMWISTRSLAEPRVVFGRVAAGELTAEPERVCWQMGAPGEDTKISIQAAVLKGRAGHVRATDVPGTWELVVREFAVDPDGDYVDTLWCPPFEAGWAFQACCVRSGADCFNELEYHVPAPMTKAGSNVSRDESRVWAFRGGAESMAEVARVLLGCDIVIPCRPA